MIDEELLELAAKATGSDFSNKLIPEVQGKRKGPFILKGSRWVQWNPLTDDGDALRLAVKLKMTLGVGVARGDAGEATEFDLCHRDPCAATRRAIVRAAAEIGRNMK